MATSTETQRINHDVRVVDGRTIYMPGWAAAQEGWGNLKLPDLSVADAAQQYPLGTKYADGDRVFKYGAFQGTVNPDLGVKDTQPQSVAFVSVQATTTQYATSLTLTVGASDGIAGDGVIAVNALAGGFLVVFDATSKAFTRQIVSNTVVAGGGGTMTVVVSDPIPVALTTSDSGECMASQYSYLTASTNAAYSVVGMPQLVYTSGQFGWVQTWGPTWIAPQSAVGSGSNNKIGIFRHDGSIDELDYTDNNNNKGQIAGYVLTHSQAGGQGAPFFFLQISN